MATVVVHGALGVFAWYAHAAPAPPTLVSRDLMVTRLVALGKPRDKFWLPRIPVPPRPQAPPPSIKVTDDMLAQAAPKEAPRPEDPEVSTEMRRALERARKLAETSAPEEPPEGSLTGSTAGTTANASEGDAYATAIYEAIRKNWVVPTGLSLGAVAALASEVRVAVSGEGALLEPALSRSSGSDLFDDSCVQAVMMTGKVPPPPAHLRLQYQGGILLVFEGQKLAH
jgi:hypothetical protein